MLLLAAPMAVTQELYLVYVCMCIRNWPLPIGAFQDQCKQINITWLRIPTGGRQTSWLFTSVDEKLNSGLLRTTSASGQNGI